MDCSSRPHLEVDFYIEDVGGLDLCKQVSLFFHTIVLQVMNR